ncbi:MAG: peptidoglycan-binding domain-containing protein [Nanoarchaeota archaeon]|nr:peptidoglycan-binding domain-containing protein [Nanoarchaeota archaeon]
MKNYKSKIFFFVSLFFIFGFGGVFEVKAFSERELRNFYIDSSYDLYGRENVETYLIRTTDSLYFYIEKPWWDSRSPEEQNDIRIALFNLGEEFKNRIYPVLTLNFGQEWKPGIDGDGRITVLVHQIKKGRAGYFRTSDQYYKFQTYDSNEREMVYLSSEFVVTSLAKSLLAHEFTHLITFNQKDRLKGVSEEVWLNEARAEAAITLLDYDSQYQGSNLERRVQEFLKSPSDSITEWQGSSADYGALNLFTQYLVDHYGVRILRDSLQSSEIGIASINYGLKKNGIEEDFSRIFINWTIAVLVNDCSLGSKYCYKNPDLKNLRLVPESNFLPMAAESSLSVYSQIKDWSAKWQRIFGGKGDLTLKFNGEKEVKFKVAYVLCDYANKCLVKFFNLNEQQKGEIIFPEFSSKYSSLTIIPSVQNKLSGFTGSDPAYLFSWEVRAKEFSQDNPELIRKLLEQIASLKAEIARLQAEINAILSGGSSSYSCLEIKNNLYFGMQNNSEVSCLQEFLKSQGTNIYPEGLVTGNFLSLTQQAVIRFQEKYASEILVPLGLNSGTGYVGQVTRNKINQMIGF